MGTAAGGRPPSFPGHDPSAAAAAAAGAAAAAHDGLAARSDADWMAAALGLARRGLGRVWPNPAVGCVLVRDGVLLGEGWTCPGGIPHAETEAIRRVTALHGAAALAGATAYVTLEPCDHHGRTPPCSLALIAAGVTRVVAALEDPDPRVAGGGLRRLAAAGIAVETGVRQAEAAALNAGFLTRLRLGRPLVALKLATTLDGRIALDSGESRWITGPQARQAGQALRATHDAVAVGIGTALADDPALTCRLPGLAGRSPVRIVVDSRARLPLTSQLVRTARDTPTWLIAGPQAQTAALEAAGVEVLRAATDGDGRIDPQAALQALGGRGLTRLLVEGGGELAAALLRAGLVDLIHWFRAPAVIGGDGRPAVAALALSNLATAPRFSRIDLRQCGVDLLETLQRNT